MPGKPWTPAEDRQLRRLYKTHTAAEIARIMGRTLPSIDNRLHKLAIYKPAEHINGGRFQPGGVPHNKGKPHPATGRAAETQFKPGRPPHKASNYRPIGSTRVCSDGYLERKVSDDQSIATARRWVGVHRLVWMAAHGPIPAGMLVVFRPGMHTLVEDEITLDRLEMISRVENMARNTVNRLPKELAQLVQLRGALNRQLNKRMTQHENH